MELITEIEMSTNENDSVLEQSLLRLIRVKLQELGKVEPIYQPPDDVNLH